MATILVVEDHAMTRTVINRRLAKEGHAILEAASGVAGIQILESANVDLVILDFMMKTMNGMQTYERMKDIKPQVPCVMVTAYAHAGLIKQFMSEGGADFIVKPIREDFEQRINAILAKRGKLGDVDEDDAKLLYPEN